MKLSELMRQLAYGELSNLSMVTDSGAAGQIRAADRPKVVIAANEGLLRLHSRFVLKTKDVLIEMQDGVTNYHLKSEFAYSKAQADPDSDPDGMVPPQLDWRPTPYIQDLGGEPFQDDVIKILKVYDGHIYGSAYGGAAVSPYTADDLQTYGTIQDCFYPGGVGIARGDNYSDTIALNDDEDMFSLFTPQADVLQVPYPQPGKALGVQYQARHPELDSTLTTLSALNSDQDIELPRVLVGALKAWIAGTIYGNMNGTENQNTGQVHLGRYESICNEASDKDLVSTSQSNTNVRFRKRGWV